MIVSCWTRFSDTVTPQPWQSRNGQNKGDDKLIKLYTRRQIREKAKNQELPAPPRARQVVLSPFLPWNCTPSRSEKRTASLPTWKSQACGLTALSIPTCLCTSKSKPINVHVHIHMHMRIHIRIRIRIRYTYSYTYTHTHTNIHIHLHIQIQIYIYTYTYTYTYIPIHIYQYIPIHLHTYPYIHIHTNEYIWIHMTTDYEISYIYIYMYVWFM